MELRRYFAVILRRWQVALTGFVVTAGTAVFLIVSQPPVHESSGTFVVRPRSLNAEEAVRAVDTLIRGEAINATYASIARSDLIRERAEEQLGASYRGSDLSVGSEVITGTNILSISVRGPDSGSVHDLALAVGAETTDYVRELDDAYELEVLDEPHAPKAAGPSKLFTTALGIVFGGGVAIGLALLVQYVSDVMPARTTRRFEASEEEHEGDASDIPDDRTDVHTERFFEFCVSQEMRRSTTTGATFSIGLMELKVPSARPGVDRATAASWGLKRIAQMLRSSLRKGETLACLDNGAFVVLLPEISAAEGKELLIFWELAASSVLVRDERRDGSSTQMSTTVCEYVDGRFVGDEDAVQVARRLAQGGFDDGDPDRGGAAQGQRADTW